MKIIKISLILLIILVPTIPVLNQLDQIEQDNPDFQTNQVSESLESKNDIIPEDINQLQTNRLEDPSIIESDEQETWFQGESVKVETSGSFNIPDQYLGNSTEGISYFTHTQTGDYNTTEEIDNVNFNIQNDYEDLYVEDLLNHTFIDATDDSNIGSIGPITPGDSDIRYIQRKINSTYSIPVDAISFFDVVAYYNTSYQIEIGYDSGVGTATYEASSYFSIEISAFSYTTGVYELLGNQDLTTIDHTETRSTTGSPTYILNSDDTIDFSGIAISNRHIGNNRLILRITATLIIKLEGNDVSLSIVTAAKNQIQSTNEFRLDIDLLRSQVETTESQIRSEYKYSTNKKFKIHRLKIQTLSKILNVKMSTPYGSENEWTFMNSIPSVAVTWDSTNQYYEYDSLIAATYEIQFLTNTSNIVALNDVSSDYMQSSSFESGSYHDWNTLSGEFDLSMDTSIVFDGSFSLKLDDNAGTDSLYNENSILDDGYYYISFSIYIETASATSFKFYWYNAGWESISIDQTILNRWQTYFVYAQINGLSSGRNLAFEESGNGLIAFLDNNFIGVASGTYENLGLNKFRFGSDWMYWDGLKNKAAKNIKVQGSLRDRPDDTEIYSTTVFTDTLGYAYYNFQGTLEMKEYESRWYSWDSWFIGSSDWIIFDFMEETTGWSSAIQNSDSKVGEYSIEFDGTGQSYDPAGSIWDLSNADYYTGFVKSNISATAQMNHYLMNDWSNYGFLSVGDDYSANTWYEMRVDTNNFIVTAGNPDFETIGFLFWNLGTTAKWLLDGFRFIQAQKNYFTPITSSYDPYYYETKQDSKTKNYWDFSEGTIEEAVCSSCTLISENGILEQTLTASATVGRITYTSSINANYYTKFYLRVKANTSDLRLNILNSGWAQLHTWTPLIDSYQIILIDPNNYVIGRWDDTETLFRISIEYNNGSTFDGSEMIEYDYIQLIHKDTEHEKGYNWEFEESGYLDWVGKGTPTTLTTEKGHMAIESNAVYEGGQIEFENILSTTDFIYQIRIRAESTVTNWQIEFFEDSNFKGHLQFTSYTITTEWQTFILTNPTSTQDFNVITIDSYGSGTLNTEIQVEFFRLIANSDPKGLFETDDYFYFQSENDTLVYYYELDGFKGLAYDNEIIWKNTSIGSHQLYYTAIASTDPIETRFNFLQLSTSFYYYSYQVINEFNIQVQDFSLSDYYVTFQVDSSKDFTYIIKENGSQIASGSGLSTGTTVQTVRNTTTGLIIYVIEFTNGTDTLTRNYSYSNAALSVDLTQIHLQLTNLFGTGIDFETVKVIINNSRVYGPDLFYESGLILNITIETHFNVSISSELVTVLVTNEIQDVVLIVPLYIQFFNNENEIPVVLWIQSGDYNNSFVLQSNNSVSVLLIANTYNLTIEPLVNGINNGTHILTYSTKKIVSLDLPTSDKKYSFSLSLSAALIDDSKTKGRFEDSGLPNFIINILLFLMTFWAIIVTALLIMLLKAIALYFGVSLWNMTIGLVNGDWTLWRRREFVIADNKPKESSFSAGFGEDSDLDNRTTRRKK